MNRILLTPKLVFNVILIALSIEYVKLGYSLSIFKMIIVPMSMFGAIILLKKKYHFKIWIGLFSLWIIIIQIALTGAKNKFFATFLTVIGLVVFVIFVYFYISNNSWSKTNITIISLFSLPHLITLLLFYMGISNIAYTDGEFRFDGLHYDPNFLATYVLIAFVGKLFLLKFIEKKSNVILISVAGVFDLYMLILSGSRGAILAFILVLIVWIFKNYGFKRSLYFITTFSLLMYYYIQYFIQDSFSKNYTGLNLLTKRIIALGFLENGTIENVRLYLWDEAIKRILHEGFWIGFSLAKFVKEVGQYPHNSILDAGLEAGFWGMLILSIILVFSIIKLSGESDSRANTEIFSIYLILSTFGTMLFLSNFETKLFWLILVVSFASAMKKVNFKEKSYAG